MTYMVVERFKDRNARAIYERFRDKGRMMPDTLHYVTSWIAEDFSTCWQVMETEDHADFDLWIVNWSDLVDFEIIPVMNSAEARAKALA